MNSYRHIDIHFSAFCSHMQCTFKQVIVLLHSLCNDFNGVRIFFLMNRFYECTIIQLRMATATLATLIAMCFFGDYLCVWRIYGYLYNFYIFNSKDLAGTWRVSHQARAGWGRVLTKAETFLLKSWMKCSFQARYKSHKRKLKRKKVSTQECY